MSNWTEKHVKGLLHQNKIRGYQAPEKNKPLRTQDGEKIKRSAKSEALEWLQWNLWYWANDHAITMEKEFEFAKPRKFAFDFSFPSIKVACEFEGGLFTENSGHNSVSGIQRDIEKYALAEKLGWKVIRLTPLNYTTVLKTLNEMIA